MSGSLAHELPLKSGTLRADAVELCGKTIAHHSKSFAFASRLLPPEARHEAVVLYHWCRRADDAVDDPTGDPRAAVARLRRELDSIYAGEPQDDLGLAAFQQVVKKRGIPRLYPSELIEGMAMDAGGYAYHTVDDLLLYCHRAAGTVGLMMSHVLGVSHRNALRHAAHLGMAMQLTNIARDVMEDWERGRLYLPQDLLEVCGAGDLRGYSGRKIPERYRAPMAAAVQALLVEAETYYRSGDVGIRYLGWRSGLAVRTARYVYGAIGRRIERQGCDVFAGRQYVPKRAKLGLAAVAFGESLLRWPTMRRRAPLDKLVHFQRDVLT